MALPKLASDRKTRESLEALLDDADPVLRIDVVRALGEIGDGRARPALRDRLEVDLDARVRRRIREVVRDIGEPKKMADGLRDELDRLQGEHLELKARLAKLEAMLDAGSRDAADANKKVKKVKKPKAGSDTSPEADRKSKKR